MNRRKRPTRKAKTRSAAKVRQNKSSLAHPQEQRPGIGAEATVEAVVLPEWTIQAIDPRLPPVFSTPRMIQLMEHATTRAVLHELPPGAISVGTRIEVDHLKAVPDGARVHAHARLSGYQGRFLVFDVEARSGEIIIGRGKVFRAIVTGAEHGDKARARLEDRSSS